VQQEVQQQHGTLVVNLVQNGVVQPRDGQFERGIGQRRICLDVFVQTNCKRLSMKKYDFKIIILKVN